MPLVEEIFPIPNVARRGKCRGVQVGARDGQNPVCSTAQNESTTHGSDRKTKNGRVGLEKPDGAHP